MALSLAAAIQAKLLAGDHRDLCRFHPGQRVTDGICPLCSEEAAIQPCHGTDTPNPTTYALRLKALAGQARGKGGKLTAATMDEAAIYRRAGERIAFIVERPGGWFDVTTAWSGSPPRTVTMQGGQKMRSRFPGPAWVRVYKGLGLDARLRMADAKAAARIITRS